MAKQREEQSESLPGSMTLGSHLQRIESRLDSIDSKQDRQLILLEGTPERPERGLVMRVDRLEQSEVGRKWWLRAALALAAAAVGDAIKRWIHG